MQSDFLLVDIHVYQPKQTNLYHRTHNLFTAQRTHNHSKPDETAMTPTPGQSRNCRLFSRIGPFSAVWYPSISSWNSRFIWSWFCVSWQMIKSISSTATICSHRQWTNTAIVISNSTKFWWALRLRYYDRWHHLRLFSINRLMNMTNDQNGPLRTALIDLQPSALTNRQFLGTNTSPGFNQSNSIQSLTQAIQRPPLRKAWENHFKPSVGFRKATREANFNNSN